MECAYSIMDSLLWYDARSKKDMIETPHGVQIFCGNHGVFLLLFVYLLPQHAIIKGSLMR